MLGPFITAKVGNVTLWARKLPSASDSCEQGSAVSLRRPTLTAAGQGRGWGTSLLALQGHLHSALQLSLQVPTGH